MSPAFDSQHDVKSYGTCHSPLSPVIMRPNLAE